MNSLASRVILRGLLLLGVLFLTFRYAGGLILGNFLQDLFRRGTQCQVEFTSPQLSLFPVSGSLSDFSILHPSDEDDWGVYAEKITVSLDFYDLLQKKITLRDLKIDGAGIAARSKNSAFYKTLNFILGKKEKRINASKWHSFISTGWKISLDNLLISSFGGYGGKLNGLRLVDHSRDLSWKDIEVSLYKSELCEEACQQISLDVKSRDFTLLKRGSKKIEFGPMEVSSQIDKGEIDILLFQLYDKNRIELISGAGKVGTGVRGEFDISVLTHLVGDQLKELIDVPSEIFNLSKININGIGRLSGLVDSPNLTMELEVESDEGIFRVGKARCLGEKAVALLNVSKNSLTATGFEIDKIFKKGLLEINFSDKKFLGKGNFSTGEVFQKFSDCNSGLKFANTSDKHSLQNAFEQSQVTAKISGNFEDNSYLAKLIVKTLGGKISGDLRLLSTKNITGKFFIEDLTPIEFISQDVSSEVKGVLTFDGSLQKTNFALSFPRVNFSYKDTVEALLEDTMVFTGSVGKDIGWKASLGGSWFVSGGNLKDVEQFSGRILTEIDVSGAFLNPRITSGFIKVSDGSISSYLGQNIVGVSQLDLDAEISENLINLKDFYGLLEGGEIKGRGVISDYMNPLDSNIGINFQLDNVSFEPIDNLSLIVGAELNFTMSSDKASKIAGDLRLERGYYENVISVEKFISLIQNKLLGKKSSTRERFKTENNSEKSTSDIELELNVSRSGSLLVKSNLAEVELDVNGVLVGSTSKPVFIGEVGMLRGFFEFQSYKFDLVSGSLKFDAAAELDPSIDILAETNLQLPSGDEELVRMILNGNISSPSVNFFSESGLNNSDVIAMLNTVESAGGFSILKFNKKVKRSVYDLLNPKSDLTLEERISGITGVTEVQIDPAFSTTGTNLSPKIRAKRPLGDNFDLQLESSIAGKRESAVTLKYPLSDKLDISAGWRSVSPRETESSSGSFDLGFEFSKQLPGIFFPRNVEN